MGLAKRYDPRDPSWVFLNSNQLPAGGPDEELPSQHGAGPVQAACLAGGVTDPAFASLNQAIAEGEKTPIPPLEKVKSLPVEEDPE